MLPPESGIHPLWWRYRSVTPDILDSTTDGVGTLAGLKAHANVEHTEDDDYLTSLLRSAQRDGRGLYPMADADGVILD